MKIFIDADGCPVMGVTARMFTAILVAAYFGSAFNKIRLCISMDIWDKQKRSEVMSKIKGKDTKIEMLVRRWIFAYGYRFRVNDKRYPGTPDIVLPKYKTVIFVHGCFWHGHDCKIGHTPKSNVAFWERKISRNQSRDTKNKIQLECLGWNTITVWECELLWNPEARLIQLLGQIRGEDYGI